MSRALLIANRSLTQFYSLKNNFALVLKVAPEEPAQEQSQPSAAVPSIASAASHLEALLLGAGGLPGMLDLPPDADDEAMVELAIALSLQDQASGQGLNLPGLPLPAAQAIGMPVEAAMSSDTASGKRTEKLFDLSSLQMEF